MNQPLNSGITIRPADSSDIELVQQLAHQTWPVAYANILSQAQLNYMLNLFYSTAALQQQLHEGHQFIIAQKNNEPFGFAGFNRVGDGIFKLQKLYVLPSLQKTGAGKILLHQVVAQAVALEGKKLLLNVNRLNTAKQFYEKQGFVVIATEDIDIGNNYFMNDFIMEKIIGSPDDLAAV